MGEAYAKNFVLKYKVFLIKWNMNEAYTFYIKQEGIKLYGARFTGNVFIKSTTKTFDSFN